MRAPFFECVHDRGNEITKIARNLKFGKCLSAKGSKSGDHRPSHGLNFTFSDFINFQPSMSLMNFFIVQGRYKEERVRVGGRERAEVCPQVNVEQ
jgi:hypothetical protein